MVKKGCDIGGAIWSNLGDLFPYVNWGAISSLSESSKSQGSYPPVNKHSNGKSPSWIGNTSSNGGFSIAMLDYRRLPRRFRFLLRIGKPWWTVRVLFTIRALWGHDMGASDLCMEDKRGSSLWVFRVFSKGIVSKGKKISKWWLYMTLQVVYLMIIFRVLDDSSLDMI